MKKSPIILIVILMLFFLLSCDNKISHKEHDWKNRKVTKEATCTEDGEAIVSCSCGETKTIILEKLGHDIKEIITEPTPLKKGRIDYNCSRCEVTGLKESVELEKSIVGYGVESYDQNTRHLRYCKFGENGNFYFFDYTLGEAQAFMLDATPQKYTITELNDGTVKVTISYKGYYPGEKECTISEKSGTEITIEGYKSSLNDPEPINLDLTRSPKPTDLPTQIILNNNDNEQNIIDRSNTDINWEDKSAESICQYAHWENNYLKNKLENTKFFVKYSSHDKGADNKCTVCKIQMDN